MYKQLKTKLFSLDMGRQDVAKAIGKCAAYVSQRWTGQKPWSQDDMYSICDLAQIPYHELHIYFPKRVRDSN